MCLEEVYSNPELSKELNDKIVKFKKELDDKYEQWEQHM